MAELTPRPPFSLRSLETLQQFQQKHDRVFHRDVFLMTTNRQLHHILCHLNKITGHLGDYLDKTDHEDDDNAERIKKDLAEKRVPDLFAFCLMLASHFSINLEDQYFNRIAEVEEKKLR